MNRKGVASFLMIAAMLILPLSAPAVSASTVLFSANFNGLKNGSQAPGWTPYGNVFVQNNEYEIPCVSNGCTPANGSAWSTALYTNQAFGNFNYSVRDTGLGQCGPPSLPQLPPVLTIVFRAQSSSKQPSLNTYYAWMDIDKLQISKYVNGVPTVMGTVTLASLEEQGLLSASNDTVTITHNGEQETTFNPTGTYYLEISAYGSTLSMFFKGHLELQVTDSTYASGYIGFGTYACNGSFTDVLVTQIPSVPSVELTTLLNLYNSRPDLQSAFPEVSEGIYTNLVNWAHGVVTQQWVDGSYDTLAPYGYWYTLMYTYNTSPDLQGAFPDPYFSVSSYQGLINWAGGVVTQKWSDGRYSTLQPFGYWYDLMMVYNQRSDLQTAFPNVYNSQSEYQSLINWAGGVVTKQWVDGSYSTLQPFGYWYTLMNIYNTGSDLQAAIPNAYTSQSQYQELINWAGGVVTNQWVDGRYSLLNNYGYWYDLMMVYNQRPDLQAAYPNVYTSQPQFQGLINWANNVVTGVIKPQDSAFTYLNYYASYYELHHT